jgi:hypothetical protein
VVSFTQVYPPKPCIRLSSPPYIRYMPRPSHSSLFYHLKNIGWAVKIIKLLIMKLPPLRYYLDSPRQDHFNPLTPELNLSAQRYLMRFFTWDFSSWTVLFVNI